MDERLNLFGIRPSNFVLNALIVTAWASHNLAANSWRGHNSHGGEQYDVFNEGSHFQSPPAFGAGSDHLHDYAGFR